MTTIASSTTKPVEIVSAIRERLSRLNPQRYITVNVPMRDTITATPGMRVDRGLRRKTKTTATTRMIEIISVRSTSLTEARIVVVISVKTSRCSATGIEA